MKVTVMGALGSFPQTIVKGIGSLGYKKASGNHPKNSIIKIGQNTEKNPGYLRRLAVAQTPVKNLQLTLVWKGVKVKGVKW